MVTPKEWHDAAQKALERERQRPTPLDRLTLDELREASRLLAARLEHKS
jgi:hypothetical protein